MPPMNDEKHIPLHQALTSRLLQEDVEGLIETVLKEVDINDEDRVRVRMYGRTKAAGLRELAEAMTEEEDEEDLYESLVNVWIELRAEWSRYNKTSAYRSIVFDEDISTTSAFAALSSGILQRIEPLVVRDLHRLVQFAAAPQPLLVRTGTLAESLVGEVASIDAWQHRLGLFLAESVERLRSALARPEEALCEAVDEFLQKAESQLRSVSARSTPPSAVVSTALEEMMLRSAQSRGRFVSPAVALPATDLSLEEVRQLMCNLSNSMEEVATHLTDEASEVIPVRVKILSGGNFHLAVPRRMVPSPPKRLLAVTESHREDPDNEYIGYACFSEKAAS